MGLIQAAAGAIKGTLADQWIDFFTVPSGLENTSAFFPAVSRGTNAERGSNSQFSTAVITNGSRIVIPEGYALVTLEDGAATSIATEPGAYIWDTENVNSKSVFARNSLGETFLTQSWERFKYGGRPTSQQLAFFVNTQELPNNKFGTQSEIYWDDSYLGAQAGAIARGSYTLRIMDPLRFIMNFLPAAFLQNGQVFDFTDRTNDQATQLFSEVVGVLAAAFSRYANDADKENRITNIQRDSVGFASALSATVDEAYGWSSTRGLSIEKVALVAIEYDEPTKELLQTVQRADALLGSRGNSNLQASVAAGIEAAGSDGGGAAGILGLGIAGGSVGLNELKQPAQTSIPTEPPLADSSKQGSDGLERLAELKRALEQGLISQEEFDEAKAKFLRSY